MNIQTLKGFRDFLPLEARKRAFVVGKLKKVFEIYGFEPLETPVLEYEEILTGKYGEEGEKLMYRFEDNGGRRVAMRYDQTVPLARVVAQYQGQLPTPFKRYQFQNVWRAENTQKGRYREFMQVDLDTVGIDSALADAEAIAAAVAGLQALGFEKFNVLINDRTVFEGLPQQAIIAIDKLKKIGEDGVCDELVERGISTSREEAYNILQAITQKEPTQRLKEIFTILEEMGISKENFSFSPTLARGLDYYTGLIFEIETPDYPVGSICGGGRYNKLIGMFAKNDIPAVGLAFGFDRTLEAMEALNLFPKELEQSLSKVLVTIFNEELKKESLKILKALRDKKIASEIYLGETPKLEKQLKYANAKQIPFILILGPEELKENVVVLKELATGKQEKLPLEQLLQKLQ
ncbi:MAG TPA: histidine--tRNA ligase [Patescibacteria group bacterium]|nr:histidine--tRNA ligase [Patescibacteria group bacterium]